MVEADDVTSGPVAAAIAGLREEASSGRVVSGPVTVDTSADGTVAAIEVPTVGRGSNDVATAALERIRERIVPAAFAGVEGAEVNVTGMAAQSKDFGELLAQRLPLVFAFAVLLDATLVRAILLPASMKLLGDRNWYLPSRLSWLPKVRHSEPEVKPARA